MEPVVPISIMVFGTFPLVIMQRQSMEVKALSNRVYSVEELRSLAKDYDRTALLIGFAKLNGIVYQDNPGRYHDLRLLMPGVCNAILTYAEGLQKPSDTRIYEALNIVTSSMDLKEFADESVQAHLDKKQFRLSNGYDYVPHVHYRVWWIFDWIKSNHPDFEFSKVCGVRLEDLFCITFGASSMTLSGSVPAFVPEMFFKDTLISAEEISSIVKVFKKHLPVTIEKAEVENKKILYGGVPFNDNYSVFEEWPFLELDGVYYLLLPHKVINDFMGVCSQLYIKSYSSKANNPACDVLGKAFEEYVSQLFGKVIPDLDFEPEYNNSDNERGVDVVNLKKGETPLFIEVAKTTLHKSLAKDFSSEAYETFLTERIIPKFRQTFSWLKSHDYKFNGVDVLAKLGDVQFVLVIAEVLPLTNFDDSSKLLLEMLNRCWADVTGLVGQLQIKNVYVLGVHEVERLVSVCLQTGDKPSSLLSNYCEYMIRTPQFELREDRSINARMDFLRWLITEHENARGLEADSLGYKGELLNAFSIRYRGHSIPHVKT